LKASKEIPSENKEGDESEEEVKMKE